jgi:integrase
MTGGEDGVTDAPVRSDLPVPIDAQAYVVAYAKAYAAIALSPATLLAYEHDWNEFCSWCLRHSIAPLDAPPDAIASYFASLATTHGRSALSRRLAAIGHAHRLAGIQWQPHGIVRATIRGILNAHGTAPRKAAALTSAEVRKLVEVAGAGLRGDRDRALILTGFAGALRRSEIVAIDWEHLTRVPAGMILHIPTSKTDQSHLGDELVLPMGRHRQTCPVRAIERWIEVSATTFGPVFRRIDRWGSIEHERLNPDAVRRILNRLAGKAGITVPAHERLSAHGLRAGFITETYRAGAKDEQIMAHTRHKSLAAMRGYIRRAKLGQDSAAKLLDL